MAALTKSAVYKNKTTLKKIITKVKTDVLGVFLH